MRIRDKIRSFQSFIPACITGCLAVAVVLLAMSFSAYAQSQADIIIPKGDSREINLVVTDAPPHNGPWLISAELRSDPYEDLSGFGTIYFDNNKLSQSFVINGESASSSFNSTKLFLEFAGGISLYTEYSLTVFDLVADPLWVRYDSLEGSWEWVDGIFKYGVFPAGVSGRGIVTTNYYAQPPVDGFFGSTGGRFYDFTNFPASDIWSVEVEFSVTNGESKSVVADVLLIDTDVITPFSHCVIPNSASVNYRLSDYYEDFVVDLDDKDVSWRVDPSGAPGATVVSSNKYSASIAVGSIPGTYAVNVDVPYFSLYGEASLYVIEAGSLEANASGGQSLSVDRKDVPGTNDTLYVPYTGTDAESTTEFVVAASPYSGEYGSGGNSYWPADKPAWTRTSPGSTGGDPVATNWYGTRTNEVTEAQPGMHNVSVECGNTLSLNVNVTKVDVDISGLNDSEEDQGYGKRIALNDSDDDNDGVVDFDDYQNENEQFTEMTITLSDTIDVDLARLKMSGLGGVRIWRKAGNEERNHDEDCILSGQTNDASSLGFSEGNHVVTFYLEGTAIGTTSIDVTIDPDGDGNVRFYDGDKINVTVTDEPIIKADFAMDGNRDDLIDFDDPEDEKYLFWVNDDHDCLHYEESEWHEDDSLDWASGAPDPNCDDDRIGGKGYIGGNPPADADNNCRRDLEDFTRLHMFVDDNTANLSGITYYLKFENVSSGSPSVNVFEAIDSTLNYLKQTSAADQQIQKTKIKTIGTTEQEIDGQYIATGDQPSFFILEGKSAGKGDLTLIVKKDGNEICKKSVELELKPIAEFYDKYVATISSDDDVNATSTESGTCSYSPETDEYILFVHGWNLGDWAKDRWTETVFKRLWWQKYKGHVGCFQWPTLGTLYYDRSEVRAWNSAQALWNRIASLNSSYSGQVRVLAHSMGNVVAGEALRQSSSAVVHTYIAAQAALPAHGYDSSISDYWNNFSTPNVYGHYFSGMAPEVPYFSGNSSKAGSMIQYYNALDYALGWWEQNNEMKPDLNYHYAEGDNNEDTYNPGEGDRFYYDSLVPLDERDLVFSADRYEIFARCAESRSRALGTESSVTGFSRHQNLQSFGYDNQHYSHSREFRSNIVDEKQFWSAVRSDFALTQ